MACQQGAKAGTQRRPAGAAGTARQGTETPGEGRCAAAHRVREPQPRAGCAEQIVHLPKVATAEAVKITEVPQVEYAEKIAHATQTATEEAEKTVELPQVKYVDKATEAPKRGPEEVEKTAQVPQVEIDHVPKNDTEDGSTHPPGTG